MSLISAESSAGGLTINELPNLLKQWMQLQDEISTLNAEVKQRKTKSKALRELILRIMESHKVAQLNVSKGAVVHQIREAKAPISQGSLLKHYTDFFQGDESKARALMEYLESQRSTVTKHEIKLVGGSGSSDTGSA
jgi:hypothetical protein